jgi:hypothetical protein
MQTTYLTQCNLRASIWTENGIVLLAHITLTMTMCVQFGRGIIGMFRCGGTGGATCASSVLFVLSPEASKASPSADGSALCVMVEFMLFEALLAPTELLAAIFAPACVVKYQEGVCNV